MRKYFSFIIASGWIDSLAWLMALGSFLLAYIRIIKSCYYTPLQAANDVLRGISYKFDILKPLIIFLVSLAWIITHLG
ncbi:MAG: hypothetical protein AB1847_02460 [bacterium]